MITIKTANHPTLTWTPNGLCKPPGEGEFSVETDRETVGKVVVQMLWNLGFKLGR